MKESKISFIIIISAMFLAMTFSKDAFSKDAFSKSLEEKIDTLAETGQITLEGKDLIIEEIDQVDPTSCAYSEDIEECEQFIKDLTSLIESRSLEEDILVTQEKSVGQIVRIIASTLRPSTLGDGTHDGRGNRPRNQ